MINCIQIIQNTCSNIRSALFLDKQRELNAFIVYLIQQSQNNNEQIFISQSIRQLLNDLLLTFIKYIQTYCQTFLIPYEVEIYNDENQSIDIEQLTTLVKTFP